MRIPSSNMFQRELSSISEQYEKINKLSQQQVSGNKIWLSSEDPVLANRIKMTSNYIEDLSMYTNNQTLAKNRGEHLESTMTIAANTMSKIRELLLRAANDTQSDEERAIFAGDLQNYLEDMLRVANTQDGSGNYIFAGFNVDSPAYTNQNGKYVYQGTYDTTYINVGNNAKTAYNESGFEVFGNIPNGNGSFTIKGANANTGTAYTSPGSITNNAAYVPDTYTLSFVTNGAGKLAYQVVGSVSGQVLPPPPATVPTDALEYTDNVDVNFNGISFNVKGQPQVGDTFQIASSDKANLFDTLQDLVNSLKTPIANDEVAKAKFRQNLSQLTAGFDQAQHHLQVYESTVGTRKALIDNQINTSKTLLDSQVIIKGALSDAPLEQLVTDIKQQMIGLKVTQDIYLKIQQAIFQMLQS